MNATTIVLAALGAVFFTLYLMRRRSRLSQED
jgi:hypothetical protein